MQAILASSKHELEELSQLADRITDVLSTGVNAVATVAPTKANSVDPQLSAIIDRVDWKLVYRATDYRPREILVAEAVQGHDLRTSRADIIDVSAVTPSSVRNPAAGSRKHQRNRKTRSRTISDGRWFDSGESPFGRPGPRHRH